MCNARYIFIVKKKNVVNILKFGLGEQKTMSRTKRRDDIYNTIAFVFMRRRQRVAGRPETEDRPATRRAHSVVRAKRRGLGYLHVRGQQQTRAFGQKDYYGGRDR